MITTQKFFSHQFKSILNKIINNYHSQMIGITEFMEHLLSNNIRLSSNAQFLKLNRAFETSTKLLRIQQLLNRLLLDCVQQNQKQRYYVVRISPFTIHNIKHPKHNPTTHLPSKCLQTLTRTLKKLYGNQKNWFKMLGGFTIAISIDRNIFKTSIKKILYHTAHSHCVDVIINIFLNECVTDNIEWKAFMKVINSAIRQNDSTISHKLQKSSHQINNIFNRTSNNSTQLSTDPLQKSNILTHSLSLSTQKCILYQKNINKLKQSHYLFPPHKYNSTQYQKFRRQANFYSTSLKINQSTDQSQSRCAHRYQNSIL